MGALLEGDEDLVARLQLFHQLPALAGECEHGWNAALADLDVCHMENVPKYPSFPSQKIVMSVLVC